MRALVERLCGFHFWTILLMCFATGALAVVCFAPHYWWPAGFFALPVFYLLLENAPSRKQCILRGFAFGYGHFMAGTYWISNALLVDAEKFGWLAPFSVFGLSAVFALWFALFGLLFWWQRTGDTFTNLLRFIILWVVIEYLRTLGMFGFPWNLAGYAMLAVKPIAQLASVIGVYGLSFVAIATALLPAFWIKRTGRLATACLAIVLATGFVYGLKRLQLPGNETQVALRVVQPNIPQSLKWSQDGRVISLQTHSELSGADAGDKVAPILIWSETALPFTLYGDSPWPQRLAALVPPQGILLTGAVRGDDTQEKRKLWNSLVAIDGTGEVEAAYDKHQLVPFGEFVPLRNILPLDKITPGDTDFSRGNGPRTLRVEGVPPFSPLVCYEIIFPWIVADKHDRPEWILNVTNDAWYGDSSGPYQHLAAARMRAIEQGLPVVRAANTGISAVFDGYGRIVQYIPLNEQGVIDQVLPSTLVPTFYARYGEWPVILWLLSLWLFTFRQQKVRKS